MDKEDIKFQIAQLRQDKMIYAIEACAMILICTFGFAFSTLYFPDGSRNAVNIILLIIAVAYILFMGIGNFIRLKKIIRLEKELKNAWQPNREQ